MLILPPVKRLREKRLYSKRDLPKKLDAISKPLSLQKKGVSNEMNAEKKAAFLFSPKAIIIIFFKNICVHDTPFDTNIELHLFLCTAWKKKVF